MPELPEVQTMIDTLIEEKVCNKTIKDVHVYMNKIIKNCSVNEFCNKVKNKKIKTIDRIGKYLIFHLTNNIVMSVHLRMEGKLFFEKNNDYPMDKKHLLVEFNLGDKNLLYYDTRRFGTFHIYNENDYLKSTELKKIAIDPLDNNFNWKYLKEKLHKSNKAIKTCLLDQTKVSGIGNIYVNEILFECNINPKKISNKITDEEFKNIAKHATLILKKAVKNKGTTIHTYLFKKNQIGGYQKYLKVHMHKNDPCPKCGTLIEKNEVNGRGTYYCPKCQK